VWLRRDRPAFYKQVSESTMGAVRPWEVAGVPLSQLHAIYAGLASRPRSMAEAAARWRKEKKGWGSGV
jgi:hypothetical protein